MLEGAGLLPPLLQPGQLRVHVRQYLGDGGLFIAWGNEKLSFSQELEVTVVTGWIDSFVLKLMGIKTCALAALCLNELSPICANNEVEVDELNNTGMISEYDHTTIRAPETFILSIRVTDNYFFPLIDNRNLSYRLVLRGLNLTIFCIELNSGYCQTVFSPTDH